MADNPYTTPASGPAAAPVAGINPQDLEHLKLLSIFHFIVGGLYACFSCFGLIYVGIGIAALTNPGAMDMAEDEAKIFGSMFSGIGGVIVILCLLIGGLTIYSGFCLRKHRARTFSFVVAGLTCLWVPIGTALGVFTFIVLSRDSVKALYDQQGRS